MYAKGNNWEDSTPKEVRELYEEMRDLLELGIPVEGLREALRLAVRDHKKLGGETK